MTNSKSAPRAGTIAAILVAVSLCVGFLAAASSSQAAVPIEGIWSFNGGEVGVHVEPDGSYTGTVVAETKFDRCVHPVGQEMWTGMTLQPDGSYWGFHEWYYATPSSPCTLQPAGGPTAWRVLTSPEGKRFLRVCFSEPESNSQPTIAPDGTSTNVTYGCFDSSLISSLPSLSQAEIGRYLALPSNQGCVSRAKLRIRIHDPANDPFKEILVTLNSGTTKRKAKVRRHGSGATAVLNVRGLPTGFFTVHVKFTTVLGSRYVGKRTYGICTKSKRLHPPQVHPSH